jgi:hypothetical protein
MAMKKTFIAASVGALVITSTGFAETLPDFLISELAPLIANSTAEEINPGVYDLARANQSYSDEIACIVVKYFGQSEQVAADMLAVVDDGAQQAAVVESINTCLKAGEDYEGAGYTADSFEQTISAQSTSENPSTDTNSAVTP